MIKLKIVVLWSINRLYVKILTSYMKIKGKYE